MAVYAAIIGTIAGICLGYSLLFLFAVLGRNRDKRQNLLFSLFAFGYAGTLLLGIWYRSQTTAVAFMALSRWDGIFLGLAYISLNWYVAAYTGVDGVPSQRRVRTRAPRLPQRPRLS